MLNDITPLTILWVTPFSKRSAIGKFSRLVTDALAARGVRVTIGSCERLPIAPDAAHPTDLPLILDAAVVAAELGRFDLVIYNIGNNDEYHGALHDQIAHRSGLFIFHDLYLYDVFHGWLANEGQAADHDRHLAQIYGTAMVPRPKTPLDAAAMFDYRAKHYPMLEWIAPDALGSIVHGRFGLPVLRRLTAGPIEQIPLAFTLPDGATAAAPLPAPTGYVQVTTFGDVNVNKRVESVIRAIGGSERLRDTVRYSIVGAATDAERVRLEEIAAALGVTVEFTGRASAATWVDRLHRADIICCLRFPTTESASATAIESMLVGRPLIVTDTGFYRDLPDDIVFKVDQRREIETLTGHLERLTADPALRRDIGLQAATWARAVFDPALYAARVHDFAREVIRAAPAVTVCRLIARTAATLRLRGDDPAIARWTDLAGTMFSGDAETT